MKIKGRISAQLPRFPSVTNVAKTEHGFIHAWKVNLAVRSSTLGLELISILHCKFEKKSLMENQGLHYHF